MAHQEEIKGETGMVEVVEMVEMVMTALVVPRVHPLRLEFARLRRGGFC